MKWPDVPPHILSTNLACCRTMRKKAGIPVFCLLTLIGAWSANAQSGPNSIQLEATGEYRSATSDSIETGKQLAVAIARREVLRSSAARLRNSEGCSIEARSTGSIHPGNSGNRFESGAGRQTRKYNDAPCHCHGATGANRDRSTSGQTSDRSECGRRINGSIEAG